MSYDFTKATDLVKWVQVQYKNPNYYHIGGIGRYDGKYRQFDCCGLFKCFMWHDYSTNNAYYYNKTQRDLNCEGLIAEAKEKGPISTIPEIPGVLVYQKGHMGIYIGGGIVIESTAAKYDGKQGKIYKTYFKGSGKGCDGRRTTWTHWFKSPNLKYDEAPKPSEEKTDGTYPGTYPTLPAKGYLGYGDTGSEVNKLQDLLNWCIDSKLAIDGSFGPATLETVKDYQHIYGLEVDGYFGPASLAKAKTIKKEVKTNYPGTYPTLPAKGYLGYEDKGSEVKKLQDLLNWCIDSKLAIDGSFGPATLEAVKKYQTTYDLEVDGYFGPASLAKAKTIKK